MSGELKSCCKHSPWWPLLGLLSWYPLIPVNPLQFIARTEGHPNIKMLSFQYRHFHYIERRSHCHHTFIWWSLYLKRKSVYWDRAFVPIDEIYGYPTFRWHDGIIKWKYFPRNWPFVHGIHWSPVKSPHKGQWCGTLMFFICAWINGWINIREASDLRRHHAHYDIIVMSCSDLTRGVHTCFIPKSSQWTPHRSPMRARWGVFVS